MEIPEGYFECPVCHKLIKINPERDLKASQDYINEYGLEKFEEDRPNLKRICLNCNKMLKAYLN